MPAELLTTMQKIRAKQPFCWHSLCYSPFFFFLPVLAFRMRLNSAVLHLTWVLKYFSGQVCGIQKPRMSPASLCQTLPSSPGLAVPITELVGGRVLALLVFNSFVTIESTFLVITYAPVTAKHNFQGVKSKLQSAPLRNTYLCLKAPCDRMTYPGNSYSHIYIFCMFLYLLK